MSGDFLMGLALGWAATTILSRMGQPITPDEVQNRARYTPGSPFRRRVRDAVFSGVDATKARVKDSVYSMFDDSQQPPAQDTSQAEEFIDPRTGQRWVRYGDTVEPAND